MEDYHRLGELGVLHPEQRTELLDGVIYDTPRPSALHAGTRDELVDL